MRNLRTSTPLTHRRRWNWSIRNRILVPYLLLIVAMVVLTGLATASWAASRAASQYLERGRDIAGVLQRSRFPFTMAVLQQLRGLAGAEFALLDADGRPSASTLGDLSPVADELRSLLKGQGVSFATSWTRGATAYRLGVVERTDPSGRQRLVIFLPESTLKAAQWEAGRGVLLMTVVGALLAALLASWIGQTLSRPLSEIHRTVRRIGRGDLRPRGLPAERGDEIGELASGVEKMARWLRKLRRNQVRTQRLRLIRQVSAGLAHELRNPLTAARMTLQIHIERNRDRDAEPLRIALGELSRMERQVKRFLQIARPESPRFEVADLPPIVERTLAGLMATADHQGISLAMVTTADPLPPVRVDPDQIGQVVANLVTNALEAAGPGGEVRVKVGRGAASEVVVEVEDDGPGVPPLELARLFEPFASGKPEGVGLGLALCKALVREHNGSIGHERGEGRTRFRVVLPASADRKAAIVSEAKQAWPT